MAYGFNAGGRRNCEGRTRMYVSDALLPEKMWRTNPVMGTDKITHKNIQWGYAEVSKFAGGGGNKGGLIRGPGTSISDSIPCDIRKGSFIMPADSTAFFGPQELARLCRMQPGIGSHADYQLTPEQVYTVGWNVLDAMRRSTHTPAILQAMLARHHNGRPGFDNGTTQNPIQDQNGGSTVPTAGGNPGLGSNTLNTGSQIPQGSYSSGKQAYMTPGSGSDVVHNGNSYWGTTVSGPVTINGQQPANGAFSSVPSGGGMQMPSPANTSMPAIAPPAGGSGGTISNPATGNAASMALAAASRPYAGSPNGQLTANQLRVMQGLASNDAQERSAQLSNQTAQNNAALQAETQMAQLDANNRQFQQRLAAAKAMGDPRNYGTPFQW